jgi:hypothetical protein
MSRIALASLPAALALVLVAGCASIAPPKGYIPDEKVVFLREKLEFGPIAYEPAKADPYEFAPDASKVDAERPAFVKLDRLDALLAPGFAADSRLHREVEAHLAYVAALPAFVRLRAALDGAKISAPAPFPPERGDKAKDYSNGAQYAYPGAEGAFITILDGGQYFIEFRDKSRFDFLGPGNYAMKDPSGRPLFALNGADGSATVTEDGVTFSSSGDFRRAVSPLGTAEYSPTPEPQYHYAFPGAPSGQMYTFFVDSGGKIIEHSLTNAAGLRFDFFAEDRGILVSKGDRAIAVDSKYRKQYMAFDPKANRATDLISAFLPEGLRLVNLDGKGLSYAEMAPAWPERYASKTIGPFRVLYVPKDERLLARLDARRLAEVEAADRRITGLTAQAGRSIVIPPDLESYRKLHADKPGSLLRWYPSGFEGDDYIVMWPISVPRYDAPAGQDYFFGQEFYDILSHEYVHLMVGENAGLWSEVPVWLNEGLAVFAESQYSPECKAYWDITFAVARDRGQLLEWDQVAKRGTGDFPAAKARVHYAQSYALVSALVAKYGMAKIGDYVRSFKAKVGDAGKTDLVDAYRANFRQVFGASFGESAKLLLK